MKQKKKKDEGRLDIQLNYAMSHDKQKIGLKLKGVEQLDE